MSKPNQQSNPQDLWSSSLLDTFGESVRELRQECNRVASISIARTVLLFSGFVAALLLRYWLV